MAETNQGANGKVFVSYSRKDKAFVQKLNDALDNADVQAGVDWEGIELASDWMKTTTDAIQDNDAVTSVAFSLDGSQLFTVSRKVVRIWDVKSIHLVPTNDLVSFACSHLIFNRSQSAWTFFFGDEGYCPICPNLPEPELLGQQDN